MYDSHLISFKEKAQYFNKIYPPLHPNYDPMGRVYSKPANDNEFIFKDDKLIYSKNKNLDFTKAEEVFPSFKNINNKEEDVHEKISYYLNNNIVPGFAPESFDNFKKEKIFKSKEIDDPDSYITDKTHNIKKDDLSVFNEKWFQEKEIDKKRKKNLAEAESAKDSA